MSSVQRDALRDYLQRVYRQVVLPDALLDAAASVVPLGLEWWYHGAPVNASCFQDVTYPHGTLYKRPLHVPSMCAGGSIWAALQHAIAMTHRLKDHGFRVPQAWACGQPTPLFAADHAWVEVQRLSTTSFLNGYGGRIPVHHEGGDRGCWFYRATGSGIFVDVGVSLRARSRDELARLLQLNVSMLFAPPIGPKSPQNLTSVDLAKGAHAFRGRGKYMLEQVIQLCTELRARGYDSIQLLDESLHSDESRAGRDAHAHQYEHELISCHGGCTRLPTGTLASACPPLPLRTGWNASQECKCEERASPSGTSHQLLNCLGSAPELPPPQSAVRANLQRCKDSRVKAATQSALHGPPACGTDLISPPDCSDTRWKGLCASPAVVKRVGPRAAQLTCMAETEASGASAVQEQCCSSGARLSPNSEPMDFIAPPVLRWPREHVLAVSSEVAEANGTRPIDINFVGSTHGSRPDVTVVNRRWVPRFAKRFFTNASVYVDVAPFATPNGAPVNFARYTPLGPWDQTLDRRAASRRPKGMPEANCTQAFSDREYYRILARSRYTLAPAGDVPWSMRFFEAVMAGSVPIVSDRTHTGRNLRERTFGYAYLLLAEVEAKLAAGEALPYCDGWAEHNQRVFLREQTAPSGLG